MKGNRLQFALVWLILWMAMPVWPVLGINEPPVEPCSTSWCEVVKGPTGSITFTGVTISPESPMCLGSWIYAWPEMDSTCSDVVTVTKSSPQTTNCLPLYSTNTYCPYFVTNWWVVSSLGYSGSGAGSVVAFFPTNCGSGTITFYGTWRNTHPCTGNPIGGGTISKSVNFTVVNVDIVESEKKVCVCDTTSFQLTKTCGSVTWEVSPDEPGGPHASGSSIIAGTNCGNYTITARSTINTNCIDSATLTVVKVADLSPSAGALAATNPPTYVVCIVPTNSVVTNLTVTAAPCPFSGLDETNLPACWQMNGGLGTNRLFRTVDITYVHTNIIVCTAGCSAKTNVIIVQDVKLTLAKTNVFVNADDDNANGTNDVADALSGAGSSVSGENDLVAMTLSVKGSATNELVTLSADTFWLGQIRVWANATRGPGEPLIDTGDWSKLSTNWPISSLPGTVWVEGVSASYDLADVALSLSTPFGCSASTNLTVFDVTSVSFQTNISPLLDNATLGGPGGGLAIYPDKPATNSTGDYSLVKVIVNVQPALTNLLVYLKSFDVDDPSSTNAPLDNEAGLQDNKAGSNKAGRFGGGGDTITLLTDTNGVAWTNFNVTMQPGDNFRVTASLLADFRDEIHALQTNDHGALVWNNSTNEIPGAYMTDMLTVWRRLHVEVDSMTAVTNNFVSNNITGISGSATAATNLTLGINLNTGLTPADASPNLSTSTNLGRFENGTIVIGTGAGATTNGVTGNGNDFVRNAGGFSLPARIIYGGATNSVGAVVALSGGVFTITSNLGTNKYTGGTFRTVGVDFTITTNNATNVTVSGTAQIPFWLHDDDDDSVLPQLPDVSGMADKWKAAYIVPLFDTGFDSTNDAFHLNSDSSSTSTYSDWYDGRGSIMSITDYWVVMLKSGFQTDPIEDNDSDNEGTWRAAAYLPAQSVLILQESLRDWISAPVAAGGGGGIDPATNGVPGRQTRIQEIVNHEVGHLFGVALDPAHTDGWPANAGSPYGDVMLPSNYPRASSDFGLTSLHKIRSKTKPGVGP